MQKTQICTRIFLTVFAPVVSASGGVALRGVTLPTHYAQARRTGALYDKN